MVLGPFGVKGSSRQFCLEELSGQLGIRMQARIVLLALGSILDVVRC